MLGRSLTKKEGSWKVEGGKFVRIRLDVSDVIVSCQISGDFFLVPSDGIFRLEQAVVGLPVSFGVGDLEKRLVEVASSFELIGVSVSDIVKFINTLVCSGE